MASDDIIIYDEIKKLWNDASFFYFENLLNALENRTKTLGSHPASLNPSGDRHCFRSSEGNEWSDSGSDLSELLPDLSCFVDAVLHTHHVPFRKSFL
jgi:hypothetical protein